MSIVAIEEIQKYLDQRDHGIPLTAIKHRIAEFVKERDKNVSKYSKRDANYTRKLYADREYSVREGQILERVKCLDG